MKILYIDLDGVVVDYLTGFEFSDNKRAQGFFENMRPIPGAIEAIRKLSRIYNIYFLSTAPWSNPYSWTEKRIWVEKNLGEIAFKKLILTHNKSLLIGDYLIDDRLTNGVQDFKGEHIHFTTEKFPNWNSVLDYLDK